MSGRTSAAVRGGSARAVLAGLALAAALAVCATNAEAGSCDPWPGEPKPLPALGDSDPVRAEWAALRVKELTQWAKRAEKDDPLRARQMWRRLLCIDPANGEALAGVLRARPVTIHRPNLTDQPVSVASARDPWAALDAPIGRSAEASSEASESRTRSEFRELRAAVSALDEKVRMAQFEQALASTPALRARLSRAPAGGTRTSLIAQTEVLAVTAELALGRTDAADQSFKRALAVDPALALDPATTAPKVRRALAAARGEVQ